MYRTLFTALAVALLPSSALAAPVLKPTVSVAGPIVTVGDMFEDAGAAGATPLFRAPQPGTTGRVSLADVAAAAARIGMTDYSAAGLDQVVVVREAATVDSVLLAGLVGSEIERRGQHPAGTTMQVDLTQQGLMLQAEVVDEPAVLVSLDYRGGTGFAARFQVAGIDAPVEVSGRVAFLVEAPHLVTSLKAGETVSPSDIEMRPIPADFADRAGLAQLDQLVGKAMKRNARAGLLLRLSDVAEPLAVRRNASVTVLVKAGAMTLSMQGQALSDASVGEPVRVMNPVSNKILSGVARAAGTVEIAPGGFAVAGL